MAAAAVATMQEFDAPLCQPMLFEPLSAKPVREQLWLPEIKPLPLPTDDEISLICRMHSANGGEEPPRARLGGGLYGGPSVTVGASTSASSSTAAALGRGVSRASSRGCGFADDFLGGGLQRSTRSQAARSSRTGPPRPTQRQPIDDETSVPAGVFESMMRLGSEARARATHTIAFAPRTGNPYLRRHDAPPQQAPGLEAVALHSRPASSCATDLSSAGCATDALLRAPSWQAHEPMQVA